VLKVSKVASARSAAECQWTTSSKHLTITPHHMCKPPEPGYRSPNFADSGYERYLMGFPRMQGFRPSDPNEVGSNRDVIRLRLRSPSGECHSHGDGCADNDSCAEQSAKETAGSRA
jgi:hypothetical protein